MSRISKDLENEGVTLSNQKVHKIVLALRSVLKVYYRIFIKASTAEVPEGEAMPDVAADLNARLAYQLGVRTSLKEGIIQVLCASIDTVVRQQLEAVSINEEETSGDRCRKLIQQLNLR